MSFTLPSLPYSHDAGAYMSRETLEYHHDKHHKAYVITATSCWFAAAWKESHWKTW